ncbi:MAG TPA: hypothetical protein VG276_28825 [Actinomycetes bacterium]|jgi:hypothetical protein|nr:hypothetical protein [Actinomycetes bacterium]
MSLRTLARYLRGDALDALAEELRIDRATIVRVLRAGLAANDALPTPPAGPSLYARLGHAGGIARITDGDPRGIDGLYARIAGAAWRSPDMLLLGHFRQLGPRGGHDEGEWWRWLAWHLRRAVEDLARADDPSRLGQLAPGTWPPGMTGEAFDRLGDHLAATLHDLGYPREVRADLLGRLADLRGQVVAVEDPETASDEGGKPEPPT